MKEKIIKAVKRFGRVAIAGAAMGALYTSLDAVQGTPLAVFIVPVGTALINALGKYVRENWGVRVPF